MKRKKLSAALFIAAGVVLAGANLSVAQSEAVQSLPRPAHTLIVMEENHAYQQIIGSSAAPYINSLADSGALFTNSYALTHPSQPNYLDLFSGCNQGVTDDNTPSNTPFTTANLAAELIANGFTFKGYAEGLPSVGYTGSTSGLYARKHCPWVNWQGTGANGIPASDNVPFTAFPSDYDSLPSLCFVIANLDDEMHNGSDPTTITNGDNWLKNNLGAYINWANTHNSLFILTWDEDDDNNNNHITTIFTGQPVKPGQYSEQINHYNVLRTLEDIYGLTYACNSSSASSIADCWNTIAGVNELKNPLNSITVSPNPVTRRLAVHVASVNLGDLAISVFNVFGQNTLAPVFLQKNTGDVHIDVSNLSAGVYFLRIKSGYGSVVKKFVKE